MHASALETDSAPEGQPVAAVSSTEPQRPAGRHAHIGRAEWLLCLAALALAVGLRLSGFDRALFHLINAPAAQAATLWSMLSVAGLGLSALLLCLSLLPGPAPADNRHAPLDPAPAAALIGGLLLCFPIGGAITHLFKFALSLPRPSAVLPAGDLVVIGDTLLRHSMPSGHAVTAFVMAGLLLRCLRLDDGPRRAVFGLAAAIACSRISTSAHWPSDVLAGAALGWLVAPLALHLATRLGLVRWLSRRCAHRPLLLAALVAALVMATMNTGYPLARPLQWALAVIGLLAAWRQSGLLHTQRRTQALDWLRRLGLRVAAELRAARAGGST